MYGLNDTGKKEINYADRDSSVEEALIELGKLSDELKYSEDLVDSRKMAKIFAEIYKNGYKDGQEA
ncbi:MAG: hypothetical protein AABY32_01455 [Nanoarchaeota archaeon]